MAEPMERDLTPYMAAIEEMAGARCGDARRHFLDGCSAVLRRINRIVRPSVLCDVVDGLERAAEAEGEETTTPAGS